MREGSVLGDVLAESFDEWPQAHLRQVGPQLVEHSSLADRHRQGSARHHAKRPVGQRLHPLRVEVFGKYSLEIALNEINALAQTIHRPLIVR